MCAGVVEGRLYVTPAEGGLYVTPASHRKRISLSFILLSTGFRVEESVPGKLSI